MTQPNKYFLEMEKHMKVVWEMFTRLEYRGGLKCGLHMCYTSVFENIYR